MNGVDNKLEIDERVRVVKKSGFQLSIEGNQDFPPKLCNIKKIDVVFDDSAIVEEAVNIYKSENK